jgi:hypothetical protein
VERVLNCKVIKTKRKFWDQRKTVEDALNCKVDKIKPVNAFRVRQVEDVLNHETNTTDYTEEYNTKEV